MKLAASLFITGVACITTAASAGTVTFDMQEATVETGVDHTVGFDVVVTADELDAWNAISVIFQAQQPLAINSLTPDSDFAGLNPEDPWIEPSIDPAGLTLGHFLLDPVQSILVGQLYVDVPADAPVGDYLVFVDPEDGLSELTFGASSEGLAGSATIHVIPEPTSLALVACGAWGLLRRRNRRVR